MRSLGSSTAGPGRSLRLKLAMLMAMMLMLAACGGGDDVEGADHVASNDVEEAPDPVLVGSLHPLSGGLEFEGTEAHQGLLVAVDEINDGGGISSLGGAPVEVLEADHAGNIDQGSAQATRMVQDGAVAILGTMSSGVGLAIQPLTEREQVPFMITAAADPELTARGLEYTFRAHPHIGMSVDSAIEKLQALSEQTGTPVKRIAHLRLEISAYEAITDQLKEKLPEGMELVEVATAPLDAPDFTTQVTKIRNAKPDVLILSALLSQSLDIVKTMDEQDFRPPFTVGIAAGFNHPGFAKELPKLSENIGDISYWYNPDSTVWERFQAAYEKKFGTQPTTHAAQGYQAMMIVADALERAGTTEGPALRDALAATSLEEHLLPHEGPIEFGKDGQNVNQASPLTQLIDGRPQIVLPEPLAQTEPVVPDPLATY
jgi:branched-chain amino acid transport system substrate-binding protein